MKLILSDKELDSRNFPKDVIFERINIKKLGDYSCNSSVVAIVGSRAMAIKCAEMEFPSLRLFQLTSAGFDGVPCETYRQKGVAVANAGSVYSNPIAETVIFGMLLVAKKLHKNANNRHVKLQRHYNTITELAGKSVLIMGAGNIGTSIAERLQGFGMVIEGYDPFCVDKPQYHHIVRNRKELLDNINRYDYVISTLPDNEQTKGFINAEIFEKMKKSSVVVNVGRKAVFNEKDFLYALKKKKIGGAVLDIFEKLPNPITNPFRRLSNVVVLPGVAAISQEVNERLKTHITNNLNAMLNGEQINCVINGVK